MAWYAPLRPLAIIAISTTALWATISNIGGLSQSIIAFLFTLFCPGIAFVAFLGITDKATELVMAMALSLTICGLVAVGMVYLDLWSPVGAMVLISGATIIASSLQLGMIYRNR